ncbi:unnamed protein product, partial [Tuber aestivum]
MISWRCHTRSRRFFGCWSRSGQVKEEIQSRGLPSILPGLFVFFLPVPFTPTAPPVNLPSYSPLPVIKYFLPLSSCCPGQPGQPFRELLLPPSGNSSIALSLAFSVTTWPAQSNNYATLREIEGRLKSIKNIEKITNTMKIVASTKLARAQRAMSESRAYGQTSNTVFDKAETKPQEGGKTLIIACSSDKGLCGGIHSQITKAVRRKLLEIPDADLVILGEKCKAQLGRSSSKNIVMSFANVGKDIPTFAEAQTVADQIFQLEKDYDNVEVIYNNFKSAISYEPGATYAFSEETIKNSGETSQAHLHPAMLPYVAFPGDEEYSDPKFAYNPQNPANFTAFEIEDEQLVNLREYALANTIFWALSEGHACEISARRNAMDNASKNAGDMINRFQILFNRTRQAVITGELVEIITGYVSS